MITIHTFSLRGENVNDRRGNPSCPDGHARLAASFSGSQWVATGLRPREEKGEMPNKSLLLF
ncbi:hypothetical protein N9N13_03365 [Opitutales bacterium]|nr:hypothetical protein [Opitutales bacterium]